MNKTRFQPIAMYGNYMGFHTTWFPYKIRGESFSSGIKSSHGSYLNLYDL